MGIAATERVVYGVDEAAGVIVEQVRCHPGSLSYVIGDLATGAAGIVDTEAAGHDRYDDILSRHGLRVRWVLDTHTHVDHVSSTRELAALHGCPLITCACTQSPRATMRLCDGDRLLLGATEFEAWQVPGHTRDMLVLVGAGRLFSGDTLFVGSCGRSDLPGGDHRDQWRTLRRLMTLPDDTIVHPGHDYGGNTHTTIGAERVRNPRVALTEDAFVADALSRLDMPFPDLFEPSIRANTR